MTEFEKVFNGGKELSYSLEDYWMAMSGEGPLAYQWADKPHRLVFDLIDALIFSAERERKAQDDEREACAERAVAWQKALCKADGWPCRTCTECDQLRAAIKEAGNDR